MMLMLMIISLRGRCNRGRGGGARKPRKNEGDWGEGSLNNRVEKYLAQGNSGEGLSRLPETI